MRLDEGPLDGTKNAYEPHLVVAMQYENAKGVILGHGLIRRMLVWSFIVRRQRILISCSTYQRL